MTGDKPTQKLSSFWISPLLAGSFLATGYEVTQRLMVFENKEPKPLVQLFQVEMPFPGKSLSALIRHHSESQSSVRSAENKNAPITTEESLKPKTELSEPEEKRLKTLLDALDNSFDESDSSPHNNENSTFNPSEIKKLSASTSRSTLKNQHLDALFKTLPEP